MTANNTVSDNYISDVAYESSYNPYLNPLNLHYIALQAGLRHDRLAKNFSYCDLGCGDGTTLNIIASMFPHARFYGVDFNEEHIATARRNAEAAGIDNVIYHQLDFSELSSAEFPPLDFINCFGTFSWINEILQESILKFAGQSLVDHGVFTVHYVAKPGKVQLEPLWELMRIFTADVKGSSKERARTRVKEIGTLRKAGAQFFRENPIAHARANRFTNLDLNNLAHEALSEWHTFYLDEMAGYAQQQGLQYAGLQSPADNDPDFTIADKFRPILDDYTDPVVRSSIEDYILNRGLRCDVYVKTNCKASPDASPDTRQPMWLTNPEGAVSQNVSVPSGKKISFKSPLYDAIADELRQGIRSVMELHTKPTLSSWSESEITTAVARLIAGGQVKPAIGNALVPIGTPFHDQCRPVLRMTRDILRGHIPASGFTHLPSPLLGQCVPVDQIIALSLSALLFRTGNEVSWVTKQLSDAGVAGMQGIATEIKKKDAADIANRALQITTTAVLPALVRLGVYVQAGSNER